MSSMSPRCKLITPEKKTYLYMIEVFFAKGKLRNIEEITPIPREMMPLRGGSSTAEIRKGEEVVLLWVDITSPEI
jgi:hypothetical protein